MMGMRMADGVVMPVPVMMAVVVMMAVIMAAMAVAAEQQGAREVDGEAEDGDRDRLAELDYFKRLQKNFFLLPDDRLRDYKRLQGKRED